MAGLLDWLMELGKSLVTCCKKLLGLNDDDRLWHRKLERCSYGQFSFAMVRANEPQIEDEAQVESGPHGLFIGVYDGHGGPRVSQFCRNRLFPHLTSLAQESGRITEDTLRSAITATENEFMNVVQMEIQANPETNPDVTAVGSCCLVALLWRGTLYVGNLGDSRAVIGRVDEATNRIVAEPLTRDDNVKVEEVRQEVIAAHPNDRDIVLFARGAWRVKGQIQVSKAIGDAYLKRPEYSLLPNKITEQISSPKLSAEPSMVTRVLQPNDRFLICASDGLWDQISNERAVEIVNSHPRKGIARRLLQASVEAAAKENGLTYDQVKQNTQPGSRHSIHDDMTAVVIYFNQNVAYDTSVPGLSIRGNSSNILPASFNLQGVE